MNIHHGLHVWCPWHWTQKNAPCRIPPAPHREDDILCSWQDNEQVLSLFHPCEVKMSSLLPRLHACALLRAHLPLPLLMLYGCYHLQTRIIINSALLSGVDGGRTHSLLEMCGMEKSGGTAESWHAPLTESGISSLSCNTTWQDDHDCLNKRGREKWREVGREQCKNSSFNIVRDKESEPRHLDLPLPFLPLHPSICYLELLISQCVPLQVRWEIRSVVLAVSAIWACCSFRSYFIPGQAYLSLCHCMNVWFLVCECVLTFTSTKWYR